MFDGTIENLNVGSLLTIGDSPDDYNMLVLRGEEGDILKQGPTKNIVMGFRTVSKITDPTANDDFFAGYERNSKWCNQSTGQVFTCVDATAASAVWKRIDNSRHLL